MFLAQSDCFLFADDSKLLCTGTDPQSLEDNMQGEVDVFGRWPQDFIISKCKVIDFSYKPPNLIAITLQGSYIEVVEVIKDLGLFVDRNLNWKDHLNKKTTSALRVFFLLKKIPFSSLKST